MADPYAAFEDIQGDPYADFEDVNDADQGGRFGDFLKPLFGGHNPIAETADTFVEPFVKSQQQPEIAERGGVERVGDTAAFIGSLPVRMVTQGEYGLGDIAGLVSPSIGERIQAGEQDFVGANQPELKALQAAGELSLGTFGHAVPRIQTPRAPPQRPQAPTPQSQVGVAQPTGLPTSGPARARAYVKNLDELGISRHGPAIAQAARDAENVGTITKMVEGLPVVSRDLRQSTQDFVTTGARAADEIAGKYAPGGRDIQKAGGRLESYLEDFKNARAIDREQLLTMDDASVKAVAKKSVPEIGSLKTAQDARYELALRQIPEAMRNGSDAGSGVRLMIRPRNTQEVLKSIRQRSKKMMGQSGKGAAKTGADDPIASGGFLGNIIRGLENEKRGYNLANLRNIRSEIRRRGSKIADTEGAAVTRADLQRLESALTRDVREGIANTAQRARDVGDKQLAASFDEALKLYNKADSFTRRTQEAWKDLQRVTKQSTEGRAVTSVLTAAKSGKSGDPSLLRSYRRIASNDVKDDVAAASINEMGAPTRQAGRATQEAGFSVAKFSKEFGDLSNAGRLSLFGHKPELLAKLTKLAEVGKGFADYEQLANFSRSGTHGIAGAIVLLGPGALIANVHGILTAAMSAFGVNKFMTSAAYVDWLTQSTRLQKAMRGGRLSGRNAIVATKNHVTKLKRIVTKDRSIEPEAQRAIIISIDQATKDGNNAR